MFTFICQLPADEARAEIKKADPAEQIPPTLRDFALGAINDIKSLHGPDVKVMVHVHGDFGEAHVRVSRATEAVKMPAYAEQLTQGAREEQETRTAALLNDAFSTEAENVAAETEALHKMAEDHKTD